VVVARHAQMSMAGCHKNGDSCMRMLERAAHGVVVLVSAVLFPGNVVGVPAASAAAGGPAAGRPGAVAGFITRGVLSGVAASSARDVWAVGQARVGQALIVHWNGSAGPRGPRARRRRVRRLP